MPAWTGGPTAIQYPRHFSPEDYECARTQHTRHWAGVLQQIKLGDIYTVDIEAGSCTCFYGQHVEKALPANDLRRVCEHLAKLILQRKSEFEGEWNEWTLRILQSISNGISRGVFASFSYHFLENGADRFLAIYDNSRGYVELFDRGGWCYGYDLTRNRWANAVAPNRPLEVKRTLRPWILSMDARFKDGRFQPDDEP